MNFKGPALTVRLQGHKVGCLGRLDGNRTGFFADDEWLRIGQRPSLGLTFKADPAPRIERDGRIPAWFENLLPEQGSSLRRWICRQNDIRERDSLGLLRFLGRDLPGAVEVLGETLEHQELITENVEGPPLRFSLTCVQLKLSMIRDGARFAFPAYDSTGAWIVKIPGERHPQLPEVEAATMSWAKAAGLEMPEFEVVDFQQLSGIRAEDVGSPARVFAIRRFDRGTNSEKIHQEDFAQALEFRPEHKYGGEGTWNTSYDKLGQLVLDTCGEAQAHEFVRRLAFVIAAGNDDAHLKNWSFQWTDQLRPSLSPNYDLVSTIAWPDYGWDNQKGPSLALSLGRKKRFAEINKQAVMTFARRCGIPDCVELFMESLIDFRQTWKEATEAAPPRFIKAIPLHWRKVPILAQLGALPTES